MTENRPDQNDSSGNRSGPNSFIGWQARALQLHQVSRLLRLNPESGNIRKSPRPKHPRRNNSLAPRRYSDGKQGAVEQKRGRGERRAPERFETLPAWERTPGAPRCSQTRPDALRRTTPHPDAPKHSSSVPRRSLTHSRACRRLRRSKVLPGARSAPQALPHTPRRAQMSPSVLIPNSSRAHPSAPRRSPGFPRRAQTLEKAP